LAEAIEGELGIRNGEAIIAVKWPNDVLINGKKISGIMAELEWVGEKATVVVGLGINVTTPLKNLPERTLYPASSILVESGVALDRLKLLKRWREKFDTIYDAIKACGVAPFLQRWKRWDALAGKPVRINTQTGWVEGVGDGIDADGALFVRCPDGERIRVVAGDVMPS